MDFSLDEVEEESLVQLDVVVDGAEIALLLVFLKPTCQRLRANSNGHKKVAIKHRRSPKTHLDPKTLNNLKIVHRPAHLPLSSAKYSIGKFEGSNHQLLD